MKIHFLIFAVLMVSFSCSNPKSGILQVDDQGNKITQNWQFLSSEETQQEELKIMLENLVQDLETSTKTLEANIKRENELRKFLELEEISLSDTAKKRSEFWREWMNNNPNTNLLLRADSCTNILLRYSYIHTLSLNEMINNIDR